MTAGPMTYLVLLVLALCVFVGLGTILVGLFGNNGRLKSRVCRQCRNRNPRHAKFCAHCGRRISSACCSSDERSDP
ncbi:MAG: hypothetical protein ACE5EX_07035 [Phycisphaerae bacterium]